MDRLHWGFWMMSQAKWWRWWKTVRCGGLILSYCPRNFHGKAGNEERKKEKRRKYFAKHYLYYKKKTSSEILCHSEISTQIIALIIIRDQGRHLLSQFCAFFTANRYAKKHGSVGSLIIMVCCDTALKNSSITYQKKSATVCFVWH